MLILHWLFPSDLLMKMHLAARARRSHGQRRGRWWVGWKRLDVRLEMHGNGPDAGQEFVVMDALVTQGV